jgi:hypothetical protein
LTAGCVETAMMIEIERLALENSALQLPFWLTCRLSVMDS